MKYIIDTNILIDHLRGDAEATSFLQEIEGGRRQAAISVITEYEIIVGVKSPTDQEKISLLLQMMPRLTITSSIVRKAAYFHRVYRTDIVDSLIAATASNTKASLLTRNIRHFTNIREIRIATLPIKS